MYINQKMKMAFFHNPKTAGRSIINILGIEEENITKFIHMSAVDAKRRIFQETWDDYFSFAFARNPWDRMVSLYAYHRSIEYGKFQGFNHSHQLARLYSFSEWMEINMASPRKSNWFGIPQTNWTQDVTKIFIFEDFEASMSVICDKLKLEFNNIHINASNRDDYRQYYKAQSAIDYIAKIDAATIKQFQYSF